MNIEVVSARAESAALMQRAERHFSEPSCSSSRAFDERDASPAAGGGAVSRIRARKA